MIHRRFLIEEIRHGGKQAITFILCIALSIATLIALNSFKRDVHRSLLSDAQALHGADIIIHSHYQFSESLHRAVDEFVDRGQVEQVRTHEFYSVVRAAETERSLLVDIKVVEPAYPLYGTITLGSGRDFHEALQPGTVIAAPEVLSRLSVAPGARVHIGSAVLEITDSVIHEPSRPVSLFALGPRIFVASADRDRLELLGSASRLEHEILLKVKDAEMADGLAAQLRAAALPGQERVETARTARSSVKRFFDNLLFFLSFISIFTLLLGGIGMQSSLSAMLRQKEQTIAVVKSLGASFRFLFGHYLGVVLILGLVGGLGGVGAGYAVKHVFPLLFGGVLPAGAILPLSVADVIEGLVLGLLVVALFAFLPLCRLRDIKPVAIFRGHTAGAQPTSVLLGAYLFGFLFLSALVIRQLEEVRTGLLFVLGCLGFIGLITAATAGCLNLLRRLPLPALPLRLGLRSLFRPGNATRSVTVTLVSALSLLLTIFLLQYNLFSSYIQSYPEEAPNLFLIDIQPDQRQTLRTLVGRDVPFFPVVRGRLLAINGEPIDREKERARRSDSLAREFNLTYRDTLLADELLVGGGPLFGSGRTEPGSVAVSVLDTIAELGDIKRGDRLLFTIQGVELTARVASIRTRTKSMLYPFFYFVFPEAVLGAAPQTLFAALQVDREAIPPLITRVVAAMPNISTINLAETAIRLAELMRRLSRIIVFFASFSILAGCLIMISAVFATRLARMREAVYYKVLGGRSRFVLTVLLGENVMLGLLSSLLAAVCANGAAWLLCRLYFEIGYQAHWQGTILMMVVTVILIAGIGLAGSIGIIRQKPAGFLRHQNDG